MERDNPRMVFGVPAQNKPIIPDIDDTFETRVFVPQKTKAKKQEKSSRFMTLKGESKFLKVDLGYETLQDRKKKWQDSIKPVQEKIEDKIKIHISKKEKSDFLDGIHDNTDKIYSLFMQEIIPIYAAIEPALEQAVQHSSHILKTDVEIELDTKFLDMVNDAIVLKIFDFMSERLELTPDMKNIIKQKYFNPSYGLVEGLKKKNGQ